MGRPRLIILVRHAQSEGNKNRAIHQTTPDHRVKLTKEGHRQAKEAGVKLLNMLNADDTVQFYISPYLRTRETTANMLSELKSHPNYNTIKVYEEPRIREQDFGNFQPCGAEMERIWHERAAYGHFFYRIPNGESAADAYDRVSGFNESLWRQFAEPDFPSVLVLVTHGLMTRIFLMKWYHYTVEYFEDLRNVNHCEFVIMKRNDETGKYILQNKLRTWSDYKKEQEEKRRREFPESIESDIDTPGSEGKLIRRWGGCVNGCNHAQFKWFTSGPLNENGNTRGDLAVENFQAKLQERLGVLQIGRDFGGSKSGAASDCEDSGSGGEEDIDKNSLNEKTMDVPESNMKVEASRPEMLGDSGPANSLPTNTTMEKPPCTNTHCYRNPFAGQYALGFGHTYTFLVLLLLFTFLLYIGGGWEAVLVLTEKVQYRKHLITPHFYFI